MHTRYAYVQQVECDVRRLSGAPHRRRTSHSTGLVGPNGIWCYTSRMVESAVEHVDVLIVGAGPLRHRRRPSPAGRAARARRYAILEAREAIGGTWDLFRYPGIRSDSDMYTLGYRFRPWTEAEGDRRRAVDPRLRPRDGARARHRRARSASATASCARELVDAPTRAGRSRSSAPTPARRVQLTCDFLFMCTGYYRYDEGYTPEFAGTERLRAAGRAPAALARGPRLRRQARRRDRQRRDRGDARARRWPSRPRT